MAFTAAVYTTPSPRLVEMSLSRCDPEAMERVIAQINVMITNLCQSADKYESKRDDLSAEIKVWQECADRIQRELDDL